ncbi:MAG TPA: phage major capsid protein [Balneolaceae bacterium]|nr:phage major capsid protein [Balneolaceae bacterium]
MSLNKQIKTAVEERDEFIKQAENLTKNDNLSDDEREQADRLMAKIDGLDHHIDKLKDRAQQRAERSVPVTGNDAQPGGQLSGGKALDQEGKVRLYKPNEQLSNAAYGDNNVSLGSYLRAVVDKPRNAAERKIIQNSTTSGNYELPTQVASELIDKLRAANPLLMANGAGARTVSIEGGTTKWVKITADPTATWHAEMTQETPDDPTFGSVNMAPKTVLSMTEVSRELLQDSGNIEEALTDAFVGSLNQAILNATFTGSGSDEPTGLATTITQTEEYTNGGTPDWSNFVNASKLLYDNNVPDGNRSFVQAPDVWQTLALIQDNNNRYQDAPSGIRDIPNFVSSGVSTGEAYAGDFSNVVYGFRMNITLEQFPAAAAKSYGSLWVAGARLDIATFRPNALVRIQEAAA